MSNQDGTGVRPDETGTSDEHGEPPVDPKDEKRTRGRPKEGKPVLVRMSDEERVVADLLGGGNAAKGVRLALRAAARMGPDAVRALANSPAPPKPASAVAAVRQSVPTAPGLPGAVPGGVAE